MFTKKFGTPLPMTARPPKRTAYRNLTDDPVRPIKPRAQGHPDCQTGIPVDPVSRRRRSKPNQSIKQGNPSRFAFALKPASLNSLSRHQKKKY